MTSRIEQLKQLGELKTQGVLTEAEFEDQKRFPFRSESTGIALPG